LSVGGWLPFVMVRTPRETIRSGDPPSPRESGVSQKDFAGLAGVHRTYISSIELGKVSVSIDVAMKLAEALGTPLSTIWRAIERKLQ